MPETYELIVHSELATSGTSWTISNIPNTYTDLRIMAAFVQSTVESFVGVLMRFNSDSNGVYHYITVEGTGTTSNASVSVGNQSNQSSINFGLMDNNMYSPAIIDINNYSATSNLKGVLFKSGILNDDNDSSYFRWGAGAYGGTTSINSITFTHGTSSIAAGSTVSIYGIARA